MAKGYIFDKLMNRKIEGETDLAKASDVPIDEDIVSTIDNAIGSVGVSGIEDIDSLVGKVDENTANRGTKLYKHLITVNNGTQKAFVVISLDPLPYTTSTSLREQKIVRIADTDGYDLIINDDEELVYVYTSGVSLFDSAGLNNLVSDVVTDY